MWNVQRGGRQSNVDSSTEERAMTTQTEIESTETWRLGFESLEEETLTPAPLEVRGRLPPDLEGTLYRVTPARSNVYGERVRHWFDGDGMVHALRLAGGAASLQNRFVSTRGK